MGLAITAILIFAGASFFFALAETALFSLGKWRAQQLAEQHPVAGKIVARFGPAGKGLHNDGINISAPVGTQVRAAGDGVVAYAGNELKGFGNLLLIKHADGWTTAYAHNDKLLVARGDKITQGQVIATVGRTGNVDSPQLHFEVRKGTQAMDPLEFLAKTGG